MEDKEKIIFLEGELEKIKLYLDDQEIPRMNVDQIYSIASRIKLLEIKRKLDGKQEMIESIAENSLLKACTNFIEEVRNGEGM
jgi:hypothetical protein